MRRFLGRDFVMAVILEKREINGALRIVGEKNHSLLCRDTQFDCIVPLTCRPIILCQLREYIKLLHSLYRLSIQCTE